MPTLMIPKKYQVHKHIPNSRKQKHSTVSDYQEPPRARKTNIETQTNTDDEHQQTEQTPPHNMI